MNQVVVNISEDGEIVNRDKVREFFSGWKPGMYMLTKKWWKLRSVKQNRYYRGVICMMIAQALYELGWEDIEDQDDAHEFLKRKFLKAKPMVNRQTGEVMDGTELVSTRRLSTLESEEYYEKCRRFAAEYLGIYIPLPNEAESYFNR